jgi:hypothetical protein
MWFNWDRSQLQKALIVGESVRRRLLSPKAARLTTSIWY